MESNQNQRAFPREKARVDSNVYFADDGAGASPASQGLVVLHLG